MKNKSVKEIKEIVDSLSIDKYLEYMDSKYSNQNGKKIR